MNNYATKLRCVWFNLSQAITSYLKCGSLTFYDMNLERLYLGTFFFRKAFLTRMLHWPLLGFHVFSKFSPNISNPHHICFISALHYSDLIMIHVQSKMVEMLSHIHNLFVVLHLSLSDVLCGARLNASYNMFSSRWTWIYPLRKYTIYSI